MKRAVIYLRVSTEEQAEKGFSIPAQREECIKKAKELDCENIAEYADEGVSGSILERPMLMNAMELLKSSSIDYFICFECSRLSRNVSHQLILIDSIKKYGTKLVFVRNSYEDTAEGRFQITIMAAVDEYERARLKIRTELGKRAKAKKQLLTHNPGLYGYCFDKEHDILRINEAQAQVVKLMFKWLLEDRIGPAEIARRLNDLQIVSMRGKQWSRVCVNRILRNYSYTGTLYIRRYDTRDYRLNKYKKEEEKVSIKERPKDQWIPISIPPIIEYDIWKKAKLTLDKAKRIYKKEAKEHYLLSGLLSCEFCGGTLFGRSTYKNGRLQNKYYCCINKYNYSKSKNDRCKSKLHKAEELDKEIWELVKSWILNENQIENIFSKRKLIDIDNIKERDLLYLISQKQEEKQRTINLYQKGIIDEIELDYKLKNIEAAIDILSKEHQKAEENKTIDSDFKIKDLIGITASYIDKLDIADKNKLLHIIIKEIVINEKLLKIKTLIPGYITDTV